MSGLGSVGDGAIVAAGGGQTSRGASALDFNNLSIADSSIEKTFKILMVGNSGVGKTSIMNRFADNEFSQTHIATIGDSLYIDYRTYIYGYSF